jgi:hypothetical protein
MAATFTWLHQGMTDTTIEAADKLQFAGSTFASSIAINAYNDSTHTDAGGGTPDKSSANTPNNVKWLSTTNCSHPGNANEAITAVTSGECTLRIGFTGAGSVTISNADFFAHSGGTSDFTWVPQNVRFQAFEGSETATMWTVASGSANALTIQDHTVADSTHYFYVGVSASPLTVGIKEGTGGTMGVFNMTMRLRYT